MVDQIFVVELLRKLLHGTIKQALRTEFKYAVDQQALEPWSACG